jgi:thioesterase domain-containing protein
MSATPNESDRSALRRALEAEILAEIPLARAMGLSIAAYNGASVRLAAPLAPNVNDKGCAFGGSLVSLMTVAGWALVRLAADARGIACDIYVADSEVRYLEPVWKDFEVVAALADDSDFTSLFEGIATRGKGCSRIRCHVPLGDGREAATLFARFVAITRT